LLYLSTIHAAAPFGFAVACGEVLPGAIENPGGPPAVVSNAGATDAMTDKPKSIFSEPFAQQPERIRLMIPPLSFDGLIEGVGDQIRKPIASQDLLPQQWRREPQR
jgi:hypothetical protein